jgi:hypothetical protein
LGQPRLPHDVQYEILQHLALGDVEYATFALVQRSWRITCQKALFKSIRLTDIQRVHDFVKSMMHHIHSEGFNSTRPYLKLENEVEEVMLDSDDEMDEFLELFANITPVLAKVKRLYITMRVITPHTITYSIGRLFTDIMQHSVEVIHINVSDNNEN